MSITKNTQGRKKVARQSDHSASKIQQAKPRFQAEFVEKYPNLGVVHEAEIRQFVTTVPLAHLRAYGGRFYMLMEALEAARQKPSTKTQRGVIKLIARLKQESPNRRYRQILQAMTEALPSEQGINRAAWTALRTVEMTFEWTNEYMFAFSLYTQWLKQDRQSGHKVKMKSN
ncbi:MAG: hypothetical protein V7641_4129 [Blastocatellia bacterium]